MAHKDLVAILVAEPKENYLRAVVWCTNTTRVHWDRQDHPDHPDHRDRKERRAIEECREISGSTVPPVITDYVERKD